MHITSTSIEGLLLIHLDVHADERGWFKENWQREKMVAAGLPDFRPVQNNISFNAQAGVTRGLHAEPWDKYVSLAQGRIFGAWCDLREGSATYGQVVTQELGPEMAVFVPRGVANGFQALEDNTAYSYLVTDHWSAQAQYTMVNLDMVDWPLEPTEISDKDKAHPPLSARPSMPPRKILVTGASGQLGQALKEVLDPQRAEFCTHAEFDITQPPQRQWGQYEAIINCAAYTNVDAAENDRAACWRINALGPAKLAAIAAENNLTLVQVSTDYVFSGSLPNPVGQSSLPTGQSSLPVGQQSSLPAGAEILAHGESEEPAPLNFYGASKAAGEAAAQVAPKHYVVRTSWVFGEGKNFVATMARLAHQGVSPQVVDDQWGRPTHAADLAAGIVHLLDSGAEYGVYHLSNSGPVAHWAQVAQEVFAAAGREPGAVQPVSSADYALAQAARQAAANPTAATPAASEPAASAGASSVPMPAPRPENSAFDLSKIISVGFSPRDWREAVREYVEGYMQSLDTPGN